MTQITIWNEFRHERTDPHVAAHYPHGMHATLAEGLTRTGLAIRTATLDEAEQGLPETVLSTTDVLIWWGHLAHDEVSDALVEHVHQCVLDGMGLIVLHSGHYSKIFRRLMGTSCSLRWREDLEREEMYGEYFDIPQPETLVFVSWFTGGEVFRSGCCYTRGHGRIFYFRPGHESFPTYHHPEVQRVIANAVRWAAPATK
jgi:trehalose utilization protein